VSSDRAKLAADVALKSAPRLAKCLAPSLEQQSQERAARAFAAGVEASGESQRAIARRLHRDERSIRDWRDGTRVVPGWALVALPRDGVLAVLRALLEDVPDEDNDEERGAA
jgi:hypothetical protein